MNVRSALCGGLAWVITLPFLSGCSEEEGGLFDHQARLMSKSLATSQFRAVTGLCSASSLSCTPSNIEGRIFSGGAMLGPLGPDAYNLTMLAADDAILQDPSVGIGGSTYFDLLHSPIYTGKISVPAESNMPEPPILTRIELNFDYVDVSFGIEGSAIDGNYTIRLVFASQTEESDVTGVMHRADKLIRSDTEPQFRWCNLQTCSTDRTTVVAGLLVDEELSNYVHPGQGNPNYVPYAIELKEIITVSYAEITDASKVWNIDIDPTAAVAFKMPPSEFSNERDVLNAFSLAYAPTHDASGPPPENQIEASLAIVLGP